MLEESSLLPFRLLSVDGGHNLESVLNDLRLAASVLSPGGIVVLDDISDDAFMEVREGLYAFLCPRRRVNGTKCIPDLPSLAPFLMLCNKLYLTTPSHHRRILEEVVQPELAQMLHLRILPEATGWGST